MAPASWAFGRSNCSDAGQDVEARLVLRDQLFQEVLVEAVQVLDRVEHREPGAHAEKQRHLAEARLQIDDDRRPLREPAPAPPRS